MMFLRFVLDEHDAMRWSAASKELSLDVVPSRRRRLAVNDAYSLERKISGIQTHPKRPLPARP
jgi:hypothetical protein